MTPGVHRVELGQPRRRTGEHYPGRIVALRHTAAATLVAAVAACAGACTAVPDHEDAPETQRSSRADADTGTSPAPSTRVEREPPPWVTGQVDATPRRTTGATDPVPREAPEPRRSYVTIPALGVRDVPVERYRGHPDDARGTALQNAGVMASPRGPRGGTAPGQVGNFIVTGHRTSHNAPLARLPELGAGDRVLVRTGEEVLVYRIGATRSTSFRSPESLARQVAPVPGSPEAKAVRPLITLSTCATPEDHAAGNFWSDRFGNPEHRIDKIGALVARR